MTEGETFGRRITAVSSPIALLELERVSGKTELFTEVDALVANVLVRSLRAEYVVETKKGLHGDSVSITGLEGDSKDTLDRWFSVVSQHARGAWFLPEKMTLKPGLASLPWTFATYPRYATGIVWEERAGVVPVDCPDAVPIWSIFQPLFEQLFAPIELRGRLVGTKSAEDQLAAWVEVDEIVAALGLELGDEFAVLRYGGGWGQLRAPEQLAAKQRLLAAMAFQANEQMAPRYRAYRLAPLIARYYSKAKGGQALRKAVLTRVLEKTLAGFFCGDWLRFLHYIEESPHPNEEVTTAIPSTDVFVGGTKSATAIAADLGLPADEVQRALSTYWVTSADRAPVSISPVEERVGVLTTYWGHFDEIHSRQAPGMPSLWGLIEEHRWELPAEWEEPDARWSPGCYRTLLPDTLLADIARLWSPTMLARWPERIVTEIFPHAALAEAFGIGLRFWQGVALTAWFVCEGPYSRTDMAGLTTYYADALSQLEAMGCAIDSTLFVELIEGEARLGPEVPIRTEKTSVEVQPGVRTEIALISATRRAGFEGLRDIITRHRRAWAERYLGEYLKARWDTELREAARHHSEAIAERGKPPTPKQFAKQAVLATNHWLGGDLSAFYGAIGEKSAVHPVRVCLMPPDRGRFASRVFEGLGGQRFVRHIVVANREEGHAQAEEQDRHTKLGWLAEQSLHYIQLEEALGRPPELKEFGTPGFEYRGSVLSNDTETAWEKYAAVIKAAREQPVSADVPVLLNFPVPAAIPEGPIQPDAETAAPLPPPPLPAPPQAPPAISPPDSSKAEEHSSWLRRLRGR